MRLMALYAKSFSKIPLAAAVFIVCSGAEAGVFTLGIPKWITFWGNLNVTLPAPVIFLIKVARWNQRLPGLVFLPTLWGVIWYFWEKARRGKLPQDLSSEALSEICFRDFRNALMVALFSALMYVSLVTVVFLPLMSATSAISAPPVTPSGP